MNTAESQVAAATTTSRAPAPRVPAPRGPAPRSGAVSVWSDLAPAPDVHRQRRVIMRWMFVADLVLLFALVAVCWHVRAALDGVLWAETGAQDAAVWPGTVVVAAWMTLLVVRGVYRPRHLAADVDELRTIVSTSAYALAVTGLIAYASDWPLSRTFVAIAFGAGTILLLCTHLLLRKLVHRARRRGHLRHRAVIVGAPQAVAELRTTLAAKSEAGYDVVGACADDAAASGADLGVPLLGSVRDIRKVCVRAGADTVLVAGGGMSSAEDLRRIGWDLEGTRIRLAVAPNLVDVAGPRVHMGVVSGLPLVYVEEPQVDQAGGLLKRAFDVVGSGTALLLLAPVMALVALVVKLGDRGPVLYAQERIGREGASFRCLKFRTMSVDADKQEAALRAAQGHTGALWKMEHDPRVTRFGAFLRRYSLDELPQLWNVLRGDMSLVGPRPQQRWEVQTYDDDVSRRLLVRPGLTGLWQVSGRSGLSWEEAVRLDLYYVDNWSIVADLTIMARTLRAVLAADGAH